ncbi:hypothetical protein BZA05DRAFT_349558 [Tricharina praecox]|uniref:uncharacterized protein n=1 Tax=Tricharina praecox TaxID=43433 RepID=UPI00221FA432|nr:uncharacterized protein BZA05DRAFT_349558 [Tricharina praecox]KAI5855981.1 hypothetical protein BZA05DRAFT_349558 [Tricharina praecox]
MLLAIRRVIPTARQRLARPHRLGASISPRFHISTPVRCLSQTSVYLRTSGEASRPADSTVATAGSVEESNDATEKKEGAAGETAEVTEGESTFAPEVSHEEIASGVIAANGSGEAEAMEDRSPARRGRPVGSKTRTTARKPLPIPKPVLPEWFIDRIVLREDHGKGPSASLLKIDSDPPKPVVETEVSDGKPPPPATVVDVEVPVEDTPPPGANVEAEEVAGEEAPCPDADVSTGPAAGGVPNPEAASGIDAAASETSSPTEAVEPEPTAGETTVTEKGTTEAGSEAEAAPKERYRLHESVWKEISTYVQTGLLLPKGAFADGVAATKSHCILHLPKEGGLYYLDAITEKVAAEVEADLIRIDAQDFAEIAGDFLGDSRHASQSDISPIGIRSLAFDTQVTVNRAAVIEEEEDAEEDEESYEEDEDMIDPPSVGPKITTFNVLPAQLQNLFRIGRIAGAAVMPISNDGEFPFSSMAPAPTKEQSLDQRNERKMASLLSVMVSAAQAKRMRQSSSPSSSEPPKTVSNKTIIHIRDYRELERTVSGEAILKMLHNIVQTRRRKGEKIVILGTTSTEEDPAMYSKAGFKALQSRSAEAFERTIVVPPVIGRADNAIFKQDRDARIREVNIRHLRDVIRRRSGENGESATLVVPENWHLDPGELQIPGIHEAFWSFDRSHRVAIMALGQASNLPGEITLGDIAKAVRVIDDSDNIKFQWAAQEQEYLKERDKPGKVEDGPGKEKAAKPIPKNLNAHEKKLINGIINPKDIHTGFSSVRAAPATIDTMKTLTSLSLVRPEAFKYGVLATDRIPGVLLYGPPGTGKTLLARAVAKESGATVLEVSGGDIFNMYVGEGEKNVKAIFSLAKKLSPCVIFIDEADAIFGSRQSFSSRSSHREIINQFLKEWADMDSTAFIMVATNRPFDLDDAILRRLPRRILIDLPTPEDRLAILQIHLTAETLDDTINLKEIADECSLFSGSDLKNLCVSAALTCVKEENAEFEKTGKYPEKRILSKRHFDKATTEITASISDDMGTLGLIRKFDEKYGERSGKKKKKPSFGFELGQTDAKPRGGEGRVRMD